MDKLAEYLHKQHMTWLSIFVNWGTMMDDGRFFLPPFILTKVDKAEKTSYADLHESVKHNYEVLAERIEAMAYEHWAEASERQNILFAKSTDKAWSRYRAAMFVGFLGWAGFIWAVARLLNGS
ncbi:hypothetical protein KAR91_09750 [Candidatus Pacearchaeota archaeon]|nr:hypothetical protein [Candidatus Pacearchaeota archaeon]